MAPAGPPPPEKLAEAKRFWEVGQKLMKDKMFREALASFLEAYRTAPRESTLTDVAFCYRSMQDFATAYMAYSELLTRFGTTMKPAKKVTIQAAVEELAVLTGVVNIKTTEPGARVTIDGRDAAVTPVTSPQRVNLGPHTVVLTKDGFDTLTKQITVSGHDTIEIADVLQREINTGHVSVTAPAADAEVHLFIDGKDNGGIPWQGDLDPGSHAFEAHSPTLGAPEKRLDVHKRETYEVALDLKPLTGTLSVTTPSAQAEIRVDDKIVGHGAWEGPLPVGPHQLSVSLPGFAPYMQPLVLHPDEHLAREVHSTAPPAAPEPAKPVVKVHEPSREDFWGWYKHVNFYGSFPVRPPSNDVSNGAVGVTSPGATLSESGAFGGGMAWNFGYNFGWVGAEGGFTLNFDKASFAVPFAADATDPAALRGAAYLPRTESYDIYHLGAALIGGPRFTTPSRFARFTLAAKGGLGVKTGLWHMSADNVNQSFASGLAKPYLVPTFILDGGVELGGTPGTRIFLGFMMVIEHAMASPTAPSNLATAASQLSNGQNPLGTVNFAPPSAISIQHGTDVYIGPTLGFHWGS